MQLKFVIAEKATITHFGVDRIMDTILQTTTSTDVTTLFAGAGGLDRVIGKLMMTQYTFEDLGSKEKAQIRDGQRLDMFEVMDFTDEALNDFMGFRRTNSYCISLEQSAALYWAQKIPDCCLVSESEHVLKYARIKGIFTMTINEMQESLLSDAVSETILDYTPSPVVVGPFDPRVDADKVEAAFSDRLDSDLAVLKQKSYWVVVCVLFEWFGWIRLRKRADFCQWVNTHFHLDKPINAKIDLKSAIKNINVKERNLELWPNNQYRDLAFMIKDMFFGERQGLPNGFYVYAKEPQFLKQGKTWTRKDR